MVQFLWELSVDLSLVIFSFFHLFCMERKCHQLDSSARLIIVFFLSNIFIVYSNKSLSYYLSDTVAQIHTCYSGQEMS